MILTLSALFSLAQQCAPAVAPETLLAVARTESGFDPLVVAVNGTPHRVYHPQTADAARVLAEALIARGRNVDLGLGQINSRNLPRLGLAVAEAFNPCRNLWASAEVLQEGYRRAAPAPGDEQRGLRTALSIYNTGDARRGFGNGYVDRVTAAAATVVPGLQIVSAAGARGPVAAQPTGIPAAAAPLDVFAPGGVSPIAVF